MDYGSPFFLLPVSWLRRFDFGLEHGQRLKNLSDAHLAAAATHAHYLSIYQKYTSELQQLQQQQQ